MPGRHVARTVPSNPARQVVWSCAIRARSVRTPLPVAGYFTLNGDGLISLWRDYSDMGSYTRWVARLAGRQAAGKHTGREFPTKKVAFSESAS